MRTRLLALLLALSAPSTVMARNSLDLMSNSSSTNKNNKLEGVALNATAALRTITIDNSRGWYDKAHVAIFFTHNAATTVTATPTCAMDGTNYAARQSVSVSSGTATGSDIVYTKAVTGDADFYWEISIQACRKMKIVFGGASGGASDLIDVQVGLLQDEESN